MIPNYLMFEGVFTASPKKKRNSSALLSYNPRGDKSVVDRLERREAREKYHIDKHGALPDTYAIRHGKKVVTKDMENN